MNRCVNCPLAADAYCHGAAARRYCQLIDPDHPDHDPRYVEILSQISADMATAGDRKRPTVGESLTLLTTAKACPYRSTDPPCGCNGARCGLRNGAIVSTQECMECVRVHG